MTELLNLPDLPAGQAASAQLLVAVPTASTALPFKVALGAYLSTAAANVTYAPLANPSFTGVPTVPTAARGDNTTQVASTAFVAAGFVSKAARTASTSAVALDPSDGTVFINKASGSPTTVTLYSSPAIGATHVIKDARGDAGLNNITVQSATSTIDGQANFVLRANYAAICLVFNGVEWSII